MKNKLSLSLLTCLAISGGGYLYAEELSAVCPNGTTPCNIDGKTITVSGTESITDNITGNGAGITVNGSLTSTGSIDLTGGSFKNNQGGKVDIANLTGSGTSFTGNAATGALFKVNNFTLKDQSSFYIGHNGTGTNFVTIGTLTLDNSSFSKQSTTTIQKAIMKNNATFTNGFYSTTINELEIDNTSKYDNFQGGSTIKKVTNISKGGEKVTIAANGGSLVLGDLSNQTQGSMNNIDVSGKGSVEIINMQLDNTNKIDVSGNIIFNGKIDINNMDLSKTTSTPTSHKIVIKDGSNVNITNTNLTNQSINANSTGDTNGSLTITGGTFKNVNIGGAGTNLANVTLSNVNIDNSGLNKNNNITAQNVTINNVTTSNNANINAKTKLDIKNSTINNTNKITANSAEIGSSTIGANVTVTNELKALSGAVFDGSVNSGTIIAESTSEFNGTTTASDSITANTGSKFAGKVSAANKITSDGAVFGGVVTAGELETKGTTSLFINVVNITNSLTSTNAIFAKDVTANTITANSGAEFNGTVKANDSITANAGSKFAGTTNATNKITSDGAVFGGVVMANDLETIGTNLSTFNGVVKIDNSITANNANFAELVEANTINANDKATFNNEVIASTINANQGSIFNQFVSTKTINADGSKFNGVVQAFGNITASNSEFTNKVTALKLEANKDAKFSNEVIVENEIIANAGAIFDTTSQVYTKNLIATGSSFEGQVNADTITANSGALFNGTTTANDSIIANAGSKFVGDVSATNKITSNGANFEKNITTAFLDAQKGSTFDAKSNVIATDINAVGTTFSGNVLQNNSITADSSSFANAIDTNTLKATNNSSFANVTANKVTATNSNFNGTTTASDSIEANAGSKFVGDVSATNKITSTGATFEGLVSANDLVSNKDVNGVKSTFNGVVDITNSINANDTIFTKDVTANTIMANSGAVFNGTTTASDSIIANAGSSFSGKVNSDFLSAEKGSKFTNTSDVNVKQLYAVNAGFDGKVTISCDDASKCNSVIEGSNFNDLTLADKTQVVLDKQTSVNNLTLKDIDTKAYLDGGSKITGDIENHGEIYVKDGTISSKITGSGDLFSNKVEYTNDVNLSDIKGSGGKFGGITSATNDVSVDNTVFEKELSVGKTLYANQGNTFGGKVNATDAIFSLDTSKSMDNGNKISAKDVEITNSLNIKDLTITADKISTNTGTIANSNISSLIVGKGDTNTNIYAENITKGNNYKVSSSELSGGLRVDNLQTSTSHIKGQVAVNKLNATNTTFYIYGKGTDYGFQDGYSGAVIAREGAIGSGNTIQLANTNLAKLKEFNGYIPIAIVGLKQPTRADTLASSISEDFFRVTYQSKVATYELIDRFRHFNPNANGNAIWSIGVKGDDLVNASNVDDVLAGKDLSSFANGDKAAGVNYNSLEVVFGDLFDVAEYDEEAVGTANFILTSPDYIANTKNNALNKRLRLVKNQKVGNGFWLDNQMGYNKYELNSIRYKNINVGADKTNEFGNANLTLGLAASFGTAETKGTLMANSDSKGVGLYAMGVFDNGVFVDANAFYHNISSTYEASKLGIKADKTHNVYTASIESGVRFGDKYYFEPSLRYDLTSYKPTAISTDGLSISGDNQLKHTLSAKLEGGVSMLDKLDGFLAVALNKELSHKPNMLLVDEVKSNVIEGKKGDTNVGINFGLDYKINPNASINLDLGSNLYTNSDKELKGGFGFSYKF